MQQSMYFEIVNKYFPSIVLSLIEKFNDKNSENQAFTYLFRTRLQEQFSTDGRWASITANWTNVAADVVALDSTLPVKSRDSIASVTGDIPKIGMKLALKEKDMKDIENMVAAYASGNEAIKVQLINKIFEDTPKCMRGVYERIEDIFLAELSTGVGIAAGDNGLGIRLDVGYKADHQFGVAVDWTTDPDHSTPIDDLQKMIDKAEEDGNTVIEFFVDDTWLRSFYKSKQVREQYAFNQGINISANGAGVPVLDFDKAAAVLSSKFGVTITRINRRILTESNGTRNFHSPWAKGVCVAVCDYNLGDLVWTTLPEMSRPVSGVTYQNADVWMMLKKYSETEPFAEFTSSQAMVVPIVNNIDRIYTLDCQLVQE